jgi:hypothetical protein
VVMIAARIIIGHRSSGSLINIGPRYDMNFVSPNYLNLSVFTPVKTYRRA